MSYVRRNWWIAIGVVAVIGFAIFFLADRKVTTGETVSRMQSGNQVAFLFNGDLYMMNMDTGESLKLTRGKAISQAALSPDGDHIALTLHRKDWSLNVLNVNTGELKETAAGTQNLAPFYWSPDGKYIAYSANQIKVVDLGGNTVQEIDTGNIYASYGYSWSPDGKQFLYIGLDNLPKPATPFYVIDAWGSASPQLLFSLDGYKFAPKWSSDGSRFLFKMQTENPTNEALYLASMDGSNVQKIINSLARSMDVFWSPDGSQILFEDVDGQICRYQVSTGEALCDFAGFDPHWDGVRIVYQDFEYQRICMFSDLTGQKCFPRPGNGAVYLIGWHP